MFDLLNTHFGLLIDVSKHPETTLCAQVEKLKIYFKCAAMLSVTLPREKFFY